MPAAPKPAQPAPDAPLDLVEWRVDSKPFERDGSHRCRYVPYLDAARVATLLDQWVGPDRWRDIYEPAEVAGQTVLWCHLEIRFGEVWVRKSDLGTPSNMEAQKGLVSDAFKRAAILKWGVGRNVYMLPTLWAPCDVDSKGNARPNRETSRSIRDSLHQRGITANAHVRDEDATGGTEGSGEHSGPVPPDAPGEAETASASPTNAAEAGEATPPSPPAAQGDLPDPAPGGSPDLDADAERRRVAVCAATSDIGLTDDQRHQLIFAVTGGRSSSSRNVTAEDVAKIRAACVRLKSEKLRLEIHADTGRPVLIDTQFGWPSSDYPNPIPPADPPEAQAPAAGAPAGDASMDLATTRSALTGKEWVAKAARYGLKQGGLVRKARQLAGELGVTLPQDEDHIVGPQLIAALHDWIESHPVKQERAA